MKAAAALFHGWLIALGDYGAGGVEDGIRQMSRSSKNFFYASEAVSLRIETRLPLCVTIAFAFPNR